MLYIYDLYNFYFFFDSSVKNKIVGLSNTLNHLFRVCLKQMIFQSICLFTFNVIISAKTIIKMFINTLFRVTLPSGTSQVAASLSLCQMRSNNNSNVNETSFDVTLLFGKCLKFDPDFL